jgi:hypothetical protein
LSGQPPPEAFSLGYHETWVKPDANHQRVLRNSDPDVLEGQVPRRALALILEWAQEHRAELMEDWELCARNQPPNKIRPLR